MIQSVKKLSFRPSVLFFHRTKIFHGEFNRLNSSQISRSLSVTKYQGPLRVRRVRVRRRRLTWKKLATLVLGTGLGLLTTSVVIGSLTTGIDDLDDINIAKQQLGGAADGGNDDLDGEKEANTRGKRRDMSTSDQDNEDNLEIDLPDDTPDGAWFIPLGLARELPPKYYSSDDLEWQAFVEFARDKDRQSRVKAELCSIILQSLLQHNIVEKALGRGLKCKSYWLDIDYPQGPPPEYERYGIEWADDYIALLHRPVNYIQVNRVERALWPSAVTQSVCSTLQEIIQLQYDRFRRALGIFDDSEASHEQRKGTESRIMRKESSSSEDISNGNAHINKRSNRAANLIGTSYLLPNYPSGEWNPVPGLSLFRRELSRRWMPPALSSPPAGSIFLQGLIEYRGSVATCTVDVTATYVATESKWHFILTRIKRVQPLVQRPKGTNRPI